MKKRILCLALTVSLILAVAGCSNPKADAKDTNIRQQMENGSLNISE